VVVEVHQQIADEDGMGDFVLDLIDYLLGFFSVLLELGPGGVDSLEDAWLGEMYLLYFYLAFFILGFINFRMHFYYSLKFKRRVFISSPPPRRLKKALLLSQLSSRTRKCIGIES
jgi:hypothetical protein